jgi:hypothetical protein
MLTEKLRILQEKRANLDSQIFVQQKETEAAIATLHDAEVEMDAIKFEKRQLLSQWSSSLVGLQKRDTILNTVESEIK